MNYSDIIALARAGFTAQQIAQMSQAESAPVQQESAPVQPAPVQQEPAPVQQESAPVQPAPVQQEPAPVQQEPVQQTPDQLSAILAEMQTLKQTMQAQNRQNAELIPPTPQSAQDILSSIIAPPKRNGGRNNKEVNTI